MEFTVRTEDLESYAAQVERAALDMEQCKRYAQGESGSCLKDGQHGINLSDQGLLAIIFGGHRSAVADVEALTGRVESLLLAARRELARSATYYRDTDEGEASEFDSALPASSR